MSTIWHWTLNPETETGAALPGSRHCGFVSKGFGSGAMLDEDSRVSGKEADDGEGRSDVEQQGEAVIDVDDSFESDARDVRAAELSVVADANVSSTLPVIKQWKKHVSVKAAPEAIFENLKPELLFQNLKTEPENRLTTEILRPGIS